MIKYDQINSLRFSEYNSNHIEKCDLPDWEWMNVTWFIERDGFSWIGQPFNSKDETGALELDLVALPLQTTIDLFHVLELPLQKGYSESKINSILGSPIKKIDFTKDRFTNEYIYGQTDKYYLSCTVKQDEGLIFVSILKYEIYEKFNHV